MEQSATGKRAGVADIDLSGQVALVTGAAQGIGRSVTVELCKRGAVVYATDVDTTLIRETGELARQAAADTGNGGDCKDLELDVTSTDAVNGVVRNIGRESGRLDMLIHVAGGVCGQVSKPIEEVSDADWSAIQQVNLWGAFRAIRSVSPSMKSQRYGRIVTIASGAGRTVSLTGIQSYASAKAGEIGLTRQTAFELAPWNITVNCIAPGFILSNPSSQRQWESYGPDGQTALLRSIPLGRLGESTDIANAVLFFVSPLSSWVTGQTLSVDGGKLML